MRDPSDEQAVRRVAAGEDTALRELYDRYAGLVNGIARRVLGDATEAEDVVQTVFVQLWQQAGRYSPDRGSVPAWIGTMARTRAVDALRKHISRRESPEHIVPDGPAVTMIADLLAVREAVHNLPESQRQALELAFYEGLTQTEIAERLHRPLGTIKTRTRSALRHLRATLTPLERPGLYAAAEGSGPAASARSGGRAAPHVGAA
jgi:RNA polymerase sigma-70 factor (ECF subfamily)